MAETPKEGIILYTCSGEEIRLNTTDLDGPGSSDYIRGLSSRSIVDIAFSGIRPLIPQDDSGTICPRDTGCEVNVSTNERKQRTNAFRYKGGGTVPMPDDCVECVIRRLSEVEPI